MRAKRHAIVTLAGLVCAFPCACVGHLQRGPALQNAHGLRLLVATENTQPTLAVILPGDSDADRTIQVLFPEHVSARKQGAAEVEHLYLFRPGREGTAPDWRRAGNSLQYEADFRGIHMLARATLADDGVLFEYEFENKSNAAYEMIYAVTDPRLTGIFHDVRLERTYVHHADGFDLLGSETPARLTMPLDRWLPVRYLDSYTWPVPEKRAEKRDDGITYYNKSRVVDIPLVATLSSDRKWVAASFTRTAGNVWSNPELTCQHVDPQAALPAQGTVKLAVKMLVVQASLDEVFEAATRQRAALP